MKGEQESTAAPSSFSDILVDPNAPLVDFKPLCFAREAFSDDAFDVDQFLNDFRRRQLPLDSVLIDLKKYGTSLESQLLQLINQDYADFVNLSSNLQGVDQVIENLRAPIYSIWKEVSLLHASIEDEIEQVEDKIQEREELRQKEQFLTLFLDIYQTICKIEALLRVGEANPVTFSDSDEETSNLIQRVANDVNQLKYYVSKTKHFPFVKNLNERMERIESTMKEGLESLFCEGLKSCNKDVIANCLRTYAAIDRISDVEELYRIKKVEPYIRTVITASTYQSGGLKVIYDHILLWISSECSLLLDITRESVRGFDFLTKSVFVAIVEEMITVIPESFGAGFPEIFHSNFLMANSFLDGFEDLFVSLEELMSFRNSSVYCEFQKRWNVSIYFGLRYQGIARPLEKDLQGPLLYKNQSNLSLSSVSFSYSQLMVLWEQLKACWHPATFLVALTDSFFKLSLQLVARFSSWISFGIKSISLPVEEKKETWIATFPEDQFICLFQDLENLSLALPTTYLAFIKSTQPDLDPHIYSILYESYSNVGSLQRALQCVGTVIIEALTKQCLTALQAVRGIMHTVRATNKGPATAPSFYVQNIFSVLSTFLSSPIVSSLSDSAKKSWIVEVVTVTANKYNEWAVDMLQRAESQNSLIKKYITKPAEKQQDAPKVDQKIAIQLSFDISAFGNEIKKLGLDPDSFEPYQKLSTCFVANLPPQSE